MLPSSSALAAAALLALGCGSTPAPASPVAPQTAAASPASTAVAAAAPAATTPAPAATTPAPASAAPALPREPVPAPLTGDEKKRYGRSCKALSKALHKATEAGSGPPLGRMLGAYQAVMATPPALPDADRQTCLDLFDREMRGYVLDTLDAGARGNLVFLGKAMASAFERDHKLCPSTEHAVPAALVGRTLSLLDVAREDWTGEGWACLRPWEVLQRVALQYEVKVDPGGRSFVAFARATPLHEAQLVEWTLAGKVVGDGVELGTIERR